MNENNLMKIIGNSILSGIQYQNQKMKIDKILIDNRNLKKYIVIDETENLLLIYPLNSLPSYENKMVISKDNLKHFKVLS